MRTNRDYLTAWLADGRISAAQREAIDAIESRRRISLFVELNALLYLGVLAFAGGLAWTARHIRTAGATLPSSSPPPRS